MSFAPSHMRVAKPYSCIEVALAVAFKVAMIKLKHESRHESRFHDRFDAFVAKIPEGW